MSPIECYDKISPIKSTSPHIFPLENWLKMPTLTKNRKLSFVRHDTMGYVQNMHGKKNSMLYDAAQITQFEVMGRTGEGRVVVSG